MEVFRKLISINKNLEKFIAICKGYLYRRNNLPNSIRYCKYILEKNEIKLCNEAEDGRSNSNTDEDIICNILQKNISKRIVKQKYRHWNDIKVKDYQYGWLHVNIKSTKTTSSDNIGNLALCVYSYTNIELDLDETYNNGEMSKLLVESIKNKQFNNKLKKDYYFIVVNKTKTKEIIVNSMKGLSKITPNLSNLPFQVKWNNNKLFKYQQIKIIVNEFIKNIQKPKPHWKQIFLTNMREISILE
jgi:hypothetical protein